MNEKGMIPNFPSHSVCATNGETRHAPGVFREKAHGLPPERALIMHAVCTHDAGGVSDGRPFEQSPVSQPF